MQSIFGGFPGLCYLGDFPIYTIPWKMGWEGGGGDFRHDSDLRPKNDFIDSSISGFSSFTFYSFLPKMISVILCRKMISAIQ